MATPLPLVHSGKVREMYEVDDKYLLMVASDRISAYDVVFDETIPDKGRVLTAMTDFWSGFLADFAPTHLVTSEPAEFPVAAQIPEWAGRAMLVRRAEMLPIECIVRGYVTGSAWQEYVRSGTMHGQVLEIGLLESAKLDAPVFTPSTKAEEGHDENISYEAAAALIGDDLVAAVRDMCVEAYRRAAEHAGNRGVIIADTKFEVGFVDGELVIADEMLTPDSSRFWPVESWEPGSTPASLDKQPVRDFSTASGWNKKSPAPHLPPDVVAATRSRYVGAYEKITGMALAHWPGSTR